MVLGGGGGEMMMIVQWQWLKVVLVLLNGHGIVVGGNKVGEAIGRHVLFEIARQRSQLQAIGSAAAAAAAAAALTDQVETDRATRLARTRRRRFANAKSRIHRGRLRRMSRRDRHLGWLRRDRDHGLNEFEGRRVIGAALGIALADNTTGTLLWLGRAAGGLLLVEAVAGATAVNHLVHRLLGETLLFAVVSLDGLAGLVLVVQSIPQGLTGLFASRAFFRHGITTRFGVEANETSPVGLDLFEDALDNVGLLVFGAGGGVVVDATANDREKSLVANVAVRLFAASTNHVVHGRFKVFWQGRQGRQCHGVVRSVTIRDSGGSRRGAWLDPGHGGLGKLIAVIVGNGQRYGAIGAQHGWMVGWLVG